VVFLNGQPLQKDGRMIRFASLISACAVAALCISAPAAAQPESGTVLMGAGALASIERSARSSDFGFDSDRDGTTAGGALTLGVHLTPRVSARFEWSTTDWLEYRNDYVIYPLDAPERLAASVRAGSGDVIDPTTALSLIAPYGLTGRTRSKAGFALLGYHVGSARASFEVLGGMGWLAQTTRTSYDFRIAMPTIDLLPLRESSYTEYRAVGVAGIDAAVALTDHTAVVPQLRVFATNGNLSLRPGVGIRWTF
jgi:hypothetical protein